jgi:hypothetical protein
VDKTPALHLISCEIFDGFMTLGGRSRLFSHNSAPDDDIWGARDGMVSKDAVLAGFITTIVIIMFS